MSVIDFCSSCFSKNHCDGTSSKLNNSTIKRSKCDCLDVKSHQGLVAPCNRLLTGKTKSKGSSVISQFVWSPKNPPQMKAAKTPTYWHPKCEDENFWRWSPPKCLSPAPKAASSASATRKFGVERPKGLMIIDAIVKAILRFSWKLSSGVLGCPRKLVNG